MHILNVWTIIMQSLNIKEWKLLELQITQTWHTLCTSEGKNVSKFNTCEKCEKNYQMCTKWEVHIFNVWTIIRQSLNIKKWKLLELQITQTSVGDRQTDGPSGPTTRPAFAKATQVKKIHFALIGQPHAKRTSDSFLFNLPKFWQSVARIMHSWQL